MKIIKNFIVDSDQKNGIVTLGTFDGVHKGHFAVLKKMNEISVREPNLPKNIITFDNHPREALFPEQKVEILTTLEEKLSLFSQASIDNVLIIRFTKEFSETEPTVFIEKYILPLQPKYIIIGREHFFGHRKKGDNKHFFTYENEYNYSVIEVPTLLINGEDVSSTKIRKLLKYEGNVDRASELLGYKYKITGKVIKGNKIGKKIGYPTANLEVNRNKILPQNGVYAVNTYVNSQKYQGMIYLGKKSSISNNELSVEVNIFNFRKNIYQKIITVEFVEKIRNEMTFNNFNELKSQLDKDKNECKKIFETTQPNV